MKNYFKKFSIMFVMLLAVIGFGTIQNGSVANAATIGQSLTVSESGWKRYEDNDSYFKYNGDWPSYSGGTSRNSGGNSHYCYNGNVFFKVKTSRLRIISEIRSSYSTNVKITIDGISHNFSENGSSTVARQLMFEALDLSDSVHQILIENIDTSKYLGFDAIDIDDTGHLVNPNESISVDNSSMNLQVEQSKQLTATTTPSGAEIAWSSSDTTIATVDSNGNVTGIKEGTATITAQIKGSETKATCVITVTKGGTTEPTTPTGDANLFIELVDGNIKSYNVSSTEITKFKQWYLDRDNTTSNKPYYEFSKGDYKDYVIHDKIDWFEVR